MAVAWAPERERERERERQRERERERDREREGERRHWPSSDLEMYALPTVEARLRGGGWEGEWHALQEGEVSLSMRGHGLDHHGTLYEDRGGGAAGQGWGGSRGQVPLSFSVRGSRQGGGGAAAAQGW